MGPSGYFRSGTAHAGVVVVITKPSQEGKKVGARQLVRGHRPAGAAQSGTRGGHTPVLAHQLASAREKGTSIDIDGKGTIGEST